MVTVMGRAPTGRFSRQLEEFGINPRTLMIAGEMQS